MLALDHLVGVIKLKTTLKQDFQSGEGGGGLLDEFTGWVVGMHKKRCGMIAVGIDL